jgi:hypothetical protein
MIKEYKKNFNEIDYRFSFSITIDDLENKIENIIVVKRDFNIYNLDEQSLNSIELKETIDDVVNLINRDLKSKSRVYMWYNYDENYDVPEFSTPIPEVSQTNFKFTLYDRGKMVIQKIWSGDAYPFSVRNSVDLTNKKYKHEYNRNIEMDFTKQIAQKAAADRPDLTLIIMKLISSTCSSSYSREDNKKYINKLYIPELKLEEMVINEKLKGSYSFIGDKVIPTNQTDEKSTYEGYATKCKFGEKEYDLAPRRN